MKPLRFDPEKDPSLDLEKSFLDKNFEELIAAERTLQESGWRGNPGRPGPSAQSGGPEVREGKPAAVIGLDEAGRGAIAGPVAVGAQVVFAETERFPESLRDSKLLSEKRREWLFPAVMKWETGSVSLVEAKEIDEHGITKSLAHAARQCLLELNDSGIDVANSIILLDGSHDWLSSALKNPLLVVTRVGADRLHASVAGASLRAKVTRDRLMKKLALEHTAYDWGSNKGYGAKSHYAGIARAGLTDYHRKTWVK